jgi:hypothetical protein
MEAKADAIKAQAEAAMAQMQLAAISKVGTFSFVNRLNVSLSITNGYE